jgi:choline kinase
MKLENTNKAFVLIEQRKIISRFAEELKNDNITESIVVNDITVNANIGKKEVIKKLISNLRSDILIRCQVTIDEIDNELVTL